MKTHDIKWNTFANAPQGLQRKNIPLGAQTGKNTEVWVNNRAVVSNRPPLPDWWIDASDVSKHTLSGSNLLTYSNKGTQPGDFTDISGPSVYLQYFTSPARYEIPSANGLFQLSTPGVPVTVSGGFNSFHVYTYPRQSAEFLRLSIGPADTMELKVYRAADNNLYLYFLTSLFSGYTVIQQVLIPNNPTSDTFCVWMRYSTADAKVYITINRTQVFVLNVIIPVTEIFGVWNFSSQFVGGETGTQAAIHEHRMYAVGDSFAGAAADIVEELITKWGIVP
jgi:hypothetical protein